MPQHPDLCESRWRIRGEVCITLDVSRSFKAEDIISRLSELFVMYGMPEHIRSDNGPEFIAKAIRQWLKRLGVKTLYVEPGSPWENGYAESFHSRLRDELLSVELFASAAHARACASAWREDYNNYRPHSSLCGLPPAEFARRCAASVPATPSLQQHSDPLPVTQPLLSQHLDNKWEPSNILHRYGRGNFLPTLAGAPLAPYPAIKRPQNYPHCGLPCGLADSLGN